MEQEKWKQIYEHYQKPLFLYAISLTKNVHDAEDLVQETFVKAFLSYQSTGSLKYWLVTVLRNEFLNQCRKRKREISGDGKMEQKEQEETLLEYLVEREEKRQLLKAIQELTGTVKEVLIESVYFQMEDEEIAKLHGITRENVRKIRSRAKQKLIKRLEGEV